MAPDKARRDHRDSQYAQNHLAELIKKAAHGEPTLIESEGRALAQISRVVPEPPPLAVKRTGFLRGQITIPNDFDTMGSHEIERLFEPGQ